MSSTSRGRCRSPSNIFNPFGAQPLGFENVTQNRYQTSTYRVSPYVKGITPGRISYELRNNNVWTNLSGAPVPTNNFRYTEVNGKCVEYVESVYGWQAEVDYTDTDYYDAGSTTRTALVRGIGVYTPDPQLRLSARVGYEENHFPLQELRATRSTARDSSGVRHQRAKVNGFWEHRFFGASYLLSLENRTAAVGMECKAVAQRHYLSAGACEPAGGGRRLGAAESRYS